MENKLETIVNLFQGYEIRTVWDNDEQDYYYCVSDIVKALTDSKDPSDYWSTLKIRLKKVEGSELPTKCRKLLIKTHKGRNYPTDTLNTEYVFRLIESIPSKKSEPFKMWLAKLGKERIDEIFDPEGAINRAIDYYRNKGYDDNWIQTRLKAILNRKKLTDAWKDSGIYENYEYGLLTNEIYKTWSGMKANEYKDFKGIRKESLRDNMTELEVLLTDLGEIAVRDLIDSEKPLGLIQNIQVAKKGGNVALVARREYENLTGKQAISSCNSIGYKYDNNFFD